MQHKLTQLYTLDGSLLLLLAKILDVGIPD